MSASRRRATPGMTKEGQACGMQEKGVQEEGKERAASRSASENSWRQKAFLVRCTDLRRFRAARAYTRCVFNFFFWSPSMSNTETNANPPPLLRLREVLALFPISRSGWYEGVKSGRYPAPVKLGPRAVAWRRSDLQALLEELAKGGMDHAQA